MDRPIYNIYADKSTAIEDYIVELEKYCDFLEDKIKEISVDHNELSFENVLLKNIIRNPPKENN